MRMRGAPEFNILKEDIPDHEKKMIDEIYKNEVTTRPDKLFWLALGLIRRHECTPAQVQKIKDLPDKEKERLVQLAHYWLPGPELDAVKIKLKSTVDKSHGLGTCKVS